MRTRYFSIAVWATLLLAGCSTMQSLQSVSKADSVDAAGRVISAYHVSRLLGQANAVLTRSLMGQLPDSVDTNQRQQIRHAIDDAFQAHALTVAVRQRLVRQAQSEGRGRALVDAAKSLASPLATRMLGLRGEAGKNGFADKYNAFMQQPFDAHRKARLNQIRTLMRRMGIIDVQSAFQLSLLKTMAHTRNAVTDARHDIDQATLQRLLDKNRTTLQKQMREQVPLILLYVYRNIDDATLGAYVKLQSSPAMMWVNQALVTAIEGALDAAGRQVPKQLGHLQ